MGRPEQLMCSDRDRQNEDTLLIFKSKEEGQEEIFYWGLFKLIYLYSHCLPS